MDTKGSLLSFVRDFRRGRALFAAAVAAAALAGSAVAQTPALPNMTPSATTLTFTYTVGLAMPKAQTITIKGGSNAKITFTASLTLPAPWLVVTPLAGTTPASLTVRPNPSSLSVGLHETDIQFTSAQAGNSGMKVHIKFTVKKPTPAYTVTPNSAAFTYATDAAGFPAAKTLTLATNGEPVSFNATVSSAPWLSVSPASGIAFLGNPALLTLTVDPTGLLPQTKVYSGKLSITSSNGTPASYSVKVDLTVSAGKAVVASVFPPDVAVASLDTWITLSGNFMYPDSVVHVGSSDLTPTFIGSDAVMVLVPAAEMAVKGAVTITVSNTGAADSDPFTWNVTDPGPRVWTVVNGGSFGTNSTPPVIAPGEIISIFGTALGPDQGIVAPTPAPGGAYATTVAGSDTLVEFEVTTGNWVAAPLMYVQDGQINAVVPFKITTPADIDMRVTYATFNVVVPVHVADTAPGIFTIDASGTGQAAALNCTASGTCALNSVKNPVLRGSNLRIYATGGGKTAPLPTVEGELVTSPAPPLAAAAGATVTVGTVTVTPTSIGGVLGSIAGLVEINITVPGTVKPGKAVPISFSMGSTKSTDGPTIVVK